MISYKWLLLQFSNKTGHYSNKICIGEYSAKFNTNISMLVLHKNDWHISNKIEIKIPNFNVKVSTLHGKFVLKNILINSILMFQCFDCIKMIDLLNLNVTMHNFRIKCVLGNNLLNSILIFQCCYCIKTIDIPNFSEKWTFFEENFNWGIFC